MKWLRKYYYLILLIGTGIGYLSRVDHWEIYAEPLSEVKDWQESFMGEASRETVEVFSTAFAGRMTSPVLESMRADNGEDDINTGDFSEEASQGEGDTAGEGEAARKEDGDAVSGESEDPAFGDPAESIPLEPIFCSVEDDYFSDAVFIGDSRTVGLFKYGGLEETATFYASTGLTVYKIFDAEIVSVPGEKKKITVEEALQNNTFSKVYLMLGINEMGIGTVDTFLEKYREVVDHLQELQPDAIIYLQAIIKVTSKRSAKGDYIHNEGIEARNEGIAQMADNVKLFYIDVNPSICDEDGGLEASYTFDGVHLKAKYIEIWKDFLKSHAISS